VYTEKSTTIDTWLTSLCSKLKKSPLTLSSVKNLLGSLIYQKEDLMLFVCGCCSLIWKVLESQEIVPSFWAKACNRKTKELADVEVKILQQTKGKLIYF
jgi:hypothetical protein